MKTLKFSAILIPDAASSCRTNQTATAQYAQADGRLKAREIFREFPDVSSIEVVVVEGVMRLNGTGLAEIIKREDVTKLAFGLIDAI
jgi:hypothetical protein